MRKKLSHEEKRSNIVGIKVKTETRRKLKYIARRERTQVSTWVDGELVKLIDQYFKIAHINWDTLTDDEKDGKDDTTELTNEKRGGR